MMQNESKIKIEHAILFYKFSLGASDLVRFYDKGLPYYEAFSYLGHVVKREDLELSREEEKKGAQILEFIGAYMMITQLREVLKVEWGDGTIQGTDLVKKNIYQITRLIRNAFTHDPFKPVWDISPSAVNQEFEISNIIKFRTHGLHGKRLDRSHYGGPLALLKLAEYIQKNF